MTTTVIVKNDGPGKIQMNDGPELAPGEEGTFYVHAGGNLMIVETEHNYVPPPAPAAPPQPDGGAA